MNPNQYEQLKILIKRRTEQDANADNLFFLKYDKDKEITIILLKTCRESIKKEVGKIIKLSNDELDVCYFKGLESLCRSINKSKFQYKHEKSIESYLFIACKGNATRFIEQKKKRNSSYSIEDFLEFHIDDDEPEKESEYQKMIEAMYKALDELQTDCKGMIQNFYLNGKSHAQIVDSMPQLLSVKNSSAKTNRCLNKLKIKTLAIYRKLENINKY